MQRLLMTESSLVEENIKDPTATATTKEGGADEGEDEGDRKETINWGEALEQVKLVPRCHTRCSKIAQSEC